MDTVSIKKRSEIMSKIRGKNTLPELRVRKYLFAKGIRYRLHDKSLPGTPDIVSKKKKFAIQVRGCFWHGHKCKYGSYPKTNRSFWEKKIKNNIKRDKINDKKLKSLGYKLVIIWGCQLGKKELRRKLI